MNVKLIVGLGNPGDKYDKTRHNAGAWFAEAMAAKAGVVLRLDTKFHGRYAQVSEGNLSYHLLLPTTFMNHSGQAVQACAKFYKIPAQAILVVHDELDLPAGVVKLKMGGGHGGHNGLRDIMDHLNNEPFLRLRIGIGHPGHKNHVLDYVLGRPSSADEQVIQCGITSALKIVPLLCEGEIARAMQTLHTTTGQ